MKYKLLFLLIFCKILSNKQWTTQKKIYNLSNQPIDIVIACHEKDLYTLDECIQSVKKYVKNKNRIIVISKYKLTEMAEWVSEEIFPFSKKSIETEFSKIDPLLYNDPTRLERMGWYFKQILNFYAPLIIPNISSNVLILDADIIFNKPIEFVDHEGNMLHAPGTENHQPYYDHMQNLLPGLKKIYSELSGISHHMLFQKPIVEDLISLVEKHHNMKFWQAYIHAINPNWPGRSWTADYEIYFNFVLMRTNQIKLRNLKWLNINVKTDALSYQSENFDFFACHHYLRDSKILELEEKLNHDFDPFEKDINQNNLLALSAFYNKKLFVEKILNNTKNELRFKLLNDVNINSDNPLSISLKHNNVETTYQLIDYYLEIFDFENIFTNPNESEKNILSLIGRYTNNKKIFKKIINKIKKTSLDRYHKIIDNKNLLMISIWYHRDHVFKELIKAGLDIENYLIDGENIIFTLLKYELSKFLEIILSNKKYKKLINKPDSKNNYLIHLSIKNNLLEITKLFIENGADLTIKDNNNQNAFELAEKLGNPEILNLLKINKING
jgi:ankyrin repeat protein